MRGSAPNSKIIQHHAVPQGTFPHTPTLFFQLMQSKDIGDQLAINSSSTVALATNATGPMRKAIVLLFGQTCHKCGGHNHFKQACHSRSKTPRWDDRQSPFLKKGKLPQQRDRLVIWQLQGQAKRRRRRRRPKWYTIQEETAALQ